MAQIKKTIESFENRNFDTYYLDELETGEYLISKDENPIKIFKDRSLARSFFDNLILEKDNFK